MFYFNKIALLVVNPISIGLALFILLIIYSLRLRKSPCALVYRIALILAGWFYFWSCGFCQRMMCWVFSLDRYPIVEVSDIPEAEAIVDLGGGMGLNRDICSFAEINGPADRVWHSSRLWKAGKAPIVIPTGVGIGDTDTSLLYDLGIPKSSVLVENEARNTEENARFSRRILRERIGTGPQKKPRVILVTSISHMRRAMMIFKTIAPDFEYIAASCDYGEVCYLGNMTYKHFVPSVGCLFKNMIVYKECLAIFGYWLRGFRD